MKFTPVGIDIAKNVFQVHYVDEDTREIVNKPIKRMWMRTPERS
jgi:transposase